MTCLRIGHGGASALAPANTLESFDAALAVGIDMLEFDVRVREGELVLAHTLFDLRRGRCVRLADALRHLSGARFDGVELNVDLKRLGSEPALLDALRSAGLLERALISSQVAAIVHRVRELEPRARTGISIGGRAARASRRWGDWRSSVLRGLSDGCWQAVMAQHKLVDAALVADVETRHGALFAWTVNDRGLLTRLRGLGVHGIATADPRLFAAP
jgi:glycerophosphoryl diester phosphodiesterase